MLTFDLKFMSMKTDFLKWRYAYMGGRLFIDQYLQKYSARETAEDFATRKQVTYCPAFAKVGVNEIRNSIYEKMTNIVRQSKSQTYNSVIDGNVGGVDLKGNSLNYFVGLNLLTELLVMGKVAVCVDMPAFEEDETTYNLVESYKNRPYLYYYVREQIYNWEYSSNNELKYILLMNADNSFVEYRKVDGGVQFNKYPINTQPNSTEIITKDIKPVFSKLLKIPKIPVHVLEISSSLMEDVADYQVALLNICSSDVSFVIKANYPLYVEQYDNMNKDMPNSDIRVGTTKGRRIPKSVQFPEYVSPPADCLKASMEKQEQLKQEIRQLLSLNLANLTQTRKSAESKQTDSSREETGLSYIGFELEAAERKIIEFWESFENIDSGTIFVKYPEKYSLRDRESVISEAKLLLEQSKNIGSKTFRKEVSKKVIRAIFEGQIDNSTIETISKEIDGTDVVIINPADLIADVENGLVSAEYASEIRGYPKGEAKKAADEHAERLARIAAYQGDGNSDNSGNGINGVKDTQGQRNKNYNKPERDTRGPLKAPIRGKGKNNDGDS